VTEKLLTSLRDLSDTVIAATPRVLMGIGLVILALIVAKVIEKILRAILVRVKFDGLVERVGIDKTLQKIGIRQQLNHFIPRLVYFLILFLLAKTAADALELVAISEALGSFFSYLPNIIAALLLVVIGSAAGSFAGDMVAEAGKQSGIEFAPALGRVVSAMILFIVGMMAVAQLKIDTEIIRIVTSFVLAGMAIAFGLSFGLGSRDLTRNIIAGYYARRLYRIGDELELAGEKGVLKAITPTHILIQREDRMISIANNAFLDQVGKQ